MKRTKLRNGVIGLVLVSAGILAGAALAPPQQAHGEVRETPAPQAFQSGGQLSVPVLKEIAATLRQIDARLARLETVAQKLQSEQQGSGKNN